VDRVSYEEYMDELAARMARVLVRIPIMKVTQLARHLNVHRELVHRVLGKRQAWFAVTKFKSRVHQAELYGFTLRGTQHLVRLSPKSLEFWSAKEGIEARSFVHGSSVSRMVALGEVLIALSEAGLWPNYWDITLPVSKNFETEVRPSIHAWLTPSSGSGKKVGLFLFPHHRDRWKKVSYIRGVLDKVIQHTRGERVLFLVNSPHYEMALLKLQRIKVQLSLFNLLPWESFLENPHLYLKGIETANTEDAKNAFLMNPPKRLLPLPVKYKDFSALVEFPNDVYRFVAFYTNGDMGVLQDWSKLRYEDGHIVEEAGKVAMGAVYIPNEPMFQAVNKLLRKKKSLAYAHRYEEWFSGQHTSDSP